MSQQAPSPPPPQLPVSLAANPKLSSWLKFSTERQVTVSPGKVEIGQGIVTALAQIAADELDVDLSRVRMVRASTAASPNEGVTSGSLSVQQSGRALLIRNARLPAAPQSCRIRFGRQAVRLVLGHQGINDFGQIIAGKNTVQFVQREIDAVIAHAALRKIISANALGSVARSHKAFAFRCTCAFGSLALGLEHTSFEDFHRFGLVLV